MKLNVLNLVNLFFFIFDIFVAIYSFISGQFILPILFVIAGIFNLYVFLYSVSLWWKTSKKIRDEYVFECKYCNFRFNPTFWQWFFVPHIGSKRYLKCKACGARSFMKKDKL